MFLIAYSPLAQGRLVNGKEQMKHLEALSKKYGVTNGQMVLRWLVNDPNVIVIPNTSKPHRAIENACAANFTIDESDIKNMSSLLSTEESLIDTRQVRVSDDYGRKVYQTLQEAIDNKMNMSPSPIELAEQMKQGIFLKPIRLRKLSHSIDDKKYDLVEGRLRFWSWIVAHGWEKPIPSLVWQDN